jgi:hypothetical protein
MPVSIPMSLTKETKGTFVFAADRDDAVVTTVYVRKAAFPDGAPAAITLTVAS